MADFDKDVTPKLGNDFYDGFENFLKSGPPSMDDMAKDGNKKKKKKSVMKKSASNDAMGASGSGFAERIVRKSVPQSIIPDFPAADADWQSLPTTMGPTTTSDDNAYEHEGHYNDNVDDGFDNDYFTRNNNDSMPMNTAGYVSPFPDADVYSDNDGDNDGFDRNDEEEGIDGSNPFLDDTIDTDNFEYDTQEVDDPVNTNNNNRSSSSNSNANSNKTGKKSSNNFKGSTQRQNKGPVTDGGGYVIRANDDGGKLPLRPRARNAAVALNDPYANIKATIDSNRSNKIVQAQQKKLRKTKPSMVDRLRQQSKAYNTDIPFDTTLTPSSSDMGIFSNNKAMTNTIVKSRPTNKNATSKIGKVTSAQSIKRKNSIPKVPVADIHSDSMGSTKMNTNMKASSQTNYNDLSSLVANFTEGLTLKKLQEELMQSRQGLDTSERQMQKIMNAVSHDTVKMAKSSSSRR